jgi:hypothetical protein
MFVRKMRKIHSGAVEQLQLYYQEHQKRAEKLVSQLRDVLEAFQDGETDQDRDQRIAGAMHDDPERLIAECEEHMAYAGNNYLPFMLAPYQTQRPLLLNCLGLLDLESTSADLSLIDAHGLKTIPVFPRRLTATEGPLATDRKHVLRSGCRLPARASI